MIFVHRYKHNRPIIAATYCDVAGLSCWPKIFIKFSPVVVFYKFFSFDGNQERFDQLVNAPLLGQPFSGNTGANYLKFERTCLFGWSPSEPLGFFGNYSGFTNQTN